MNNEEFRKDTHCLGLVDIVVKRQGVCGSNEMLVITGRRWRELDKTPAVIPILLRLYLLLPLPMLPMGSSQVVSFHRPCEHSDSMDNSRKS